MRIELTPSGRGWLTICEGLAESGDVGTSVSVTPKNCFCHRLQEGEVGPGLRPGRCHRRDRGGRPAWHRCHQALNRRPLPLKISFTNPCRPLRELAFPAFQRKWLAQNGIGRWAYRVPAKRTR